MNRFYGKSFKQNKYAITAYLEKSDKALSLKIKDFLGIKHRITTKHKCNIAGKSQCTQINKS